jgi:hypothetical protein
LHVRARSGKVVRAFIHEATFMSYKHAATLPPNTLAAYLAAVYRVFGDVETDMRIGVANAALASLMKDHGASTAVFVTAFNPFGRRLTPDRNEARQRRLREHIDGWGLRALPGVGFDPDPASDWREASLLVLDATRESADALLRAFEQNAIVFVDAQGLPQLLLHPDYR